jgi:hypothetical protein
MTPNIYTQFPFIDSYVNTGYIYNTQPLVQRFGETYYLLRLSSILPQRFVHELLGPELGYIAVRYIMLLVACSSLFMIVRRFFGVVPALYSALLIAFSPWYLRSITWEYVDGSAITYLFAGLACILAPVRPRRLHYLAAGALLALATNSNLYSLAIAGAFVPSLIYLRHEEPFRLLLVDACMAAVGFVLAYCGLALVLSTIYPGLGLLFEMFTVKVASGLLAGGSESWFEPLGTYVFAKRNYFVLAPALVLVSGLSVLAANRGAGPRPDGKHARAMIAFTLYLGLVVAVYLVNHFAFHSPRITRFYYFSYAVIPVYLVLSAVMGTLCNQLGRALLVPLMLFAAATTLLIWHLNTNNVFANVIPLAGYIMIGIALVLGALLSNRFPALGLVSALLAASMLPGFFYRDSGSGVYENLQDKENAAMQRDAYLGAIELIHAVERYAPPSKGSISFWYDNKSHPLIGIQSTYLFGYSRVPGPFAVVDADVKSFLATKAVLVLLGLSEAELQEARQSLDKADVKVSVLKGGRYQGKVWGYDYVILELIPDDSGVGSVVQDIPLSRLRLVAEQAPASPTLEGTRLHGFTDARQWAYSFQVSLSDPSPAQLDGPFYVCASIRVVRGSVGLLLAPKGDPSGSLREVAVPAQPIMTDRCARADDAGQLIIRNQSADGPSEFYLDRVTIRRP